MVSTDLPCMGINAWRYDLEHADHERIIGPCLSCSKAVTGCSVCPLKKTCEVSPCPGTIRGGIAWYDVPINGRKYAYECPSCDNPVLTRYQKKYCSVACRRDYEWKYSEAVEQEERFRFAYETRTDAWATGTVTPDGAPFPEDGNGATSIKSGTSPDRERKK